MSEKTTERKTYGLPPLTISEAARVVGIPAIAFMQFIEDVVLPSDSERSMWVRAKRDLPEELIRLYLMQHERKMRPADPPPEQPPGPVSVAPPEPARARRRITTLSSRRRSVRNRGEP